MRKVILMYKNKELRSVILAQTLLVGIIILLSVKEVLSPVLALVLMGVSLVLINVLFTAYRYKEMGKLADYLVKLQNGDRSLELRDNTEGELSILKNELYKLSVKLNTQAELLLRDKTYLADSLSDISHQLKTPLTSMMMMVELLEEDHLPEEKRREFLHNISIGIERMEWLVQALLKLSKLDADAVVFKNGKMDVYQLLQAAIAPLLISMKIRGVTLEVEKVSEVVSMHGDVYWTTEALTNIIKNCMEHTQPGGRIQISYSDNNLYTKIQIKDTGSGIDPEDLPHIFQRFYKGKNSRSDSVGIGLALSKEIITRQKGKIEVSSQVGKGTTFELRFYR